MEVENRTESRFLMKEERYDNNNNCNVLCIRIPKALGVNKV